MVRSKRTSCRNCTNLLIINEKPNHFESDRTLCKECHQKRTEGWRKNNKHKVTALNKKKRLEDPIYYWAQRQSICVKNKCKRLSIPYTLSLDYLISIFELYCPILGLKLNYLNKSIQDDSPSLDRLIPNLGYIKGNVHVISNKANVIKSRATHEEIRKVADWVKEKINEATIS